MSTTFKLPIMRKVSVVLAVTVALALGGCEKKAPPAPPAPAVTVAKPLSQDVRSYDLFDGNVSALLEVNLDARVPGYLTKILFDDGAYVKKDKLLFIIEQDQYKQQVNLTQAVFDEAKIELGRQKSLLKENATSQAAVDKATSSFLQAEANLKLAKINLGYTEVRAPFDGLMGRHLIDVGNYLGASPQGVKLAVIQRINPIYIYFSINERDLLKYRRTSAGDRSVVNTLPIFAQLQGEKAFPHEGILDFAANQLNTSTGALQLRAEMRNEDITLLPGYYAKIMIQYGEPRKGILVPGTSLLADQQGSFLFVMGADKKVSRRNVTLGQKFGPLVDVTKGLAATDDVVINGFINISEGQVVAPSTATIDPLPTR